MGTDLYAFTLAAMNAVAPGADHAPMARHFTDVVGSERPLFVGDDDRRRTIARLLAVGYREGGLRASVVGDCLDQDKNGRCIARPQSFCTMQIHVSSGGSPALNLDPAACIRKGLEMLRTSQRSCPAHPIAWYASGPAGCENARAQRISLDRVNLAKWIYAEATRKTKAEEERQASNGGAAASGPAAAE